jgi:NAD(P)H-flavin reductase
MAIMPDAMVAADPMLPRLARVRHRRRDGPDIWTLDIETEGMEEFPFRPGQFNMLTAFGIGEIAISISGDPADPARLIHTVRAVGPVSAALTKLRADDRFALRGPFGSAWPVEEARGADVIVVAGGLGLAPLRPAIYRLLAERGRYGRVVLLYGTRGPGDILFETELESWRRRLDVEVEVTVDHGTPEWHGHVGVVTNLIGRAEFDPMHSVALICGPEIMMRFAVKALNEAGLQNEEIYLSMERNMKCAVGFCGHCQLGPVFVCKDGPVFRYDRVRPMLAVKEI